ncbi:MAG: hypothetical protein AB7U82_14060 [Blastocatellales bacterium]
MKKLIYFITIIALSAFAAACSSGNNPSSASSPDAASATTASASPAAASAKADDVPAAVRAALPNAQSITRQHKDLTDAQASGIEKRSGLKLDDKDHHSYLAFATEGGVRRQIGAITVVKAQGHEAAIVYDSQEGSPVIKAVYGESSGIPHAFLDQFKGKGHDNKLRLGQDIKTQGVDETTARALTDAIRLDVVTMQTLYGAAHSH